MQITSKASITVTAVLSAAEVLAAIPAVADIPGVQETVLDLAQKAVEQDPSGLTIVSRDVTFGPGGATVELVYAKPDATTTSATPTTGDPAATAPSSAPATSIVPPFTIPAG